MKIFYNNQDYQNELEKITKETQLKTELEYRIPAKQAIEEFLKTKEPWFIGGGPLPEGWVDIGKYAISFVFSAPVAQGIVGTAIWEALKKCYMLLKHKRNISQKETEQLVVITDQYGLNGVFKTIYFVLNADLEEAAFEDAIRKLPEVRKRLLAFLEVANITVGTDTIELNYTFSRWEIRIAIQ